MSLFKKVKHNLLIHGEIEFGPNIMTLVKALCKTIEESYVPKVCGNCAEYGTLSCLSSSFGTDGCLWVNGFDKEEED